MNKIKSRQFFGVIELTTGKNVLKKQMQTFLMLFFQQTSTIINKKCANFSNVYCDWIFHLENGKKPHISSISSLVVAFFSLSLPFVHSFQSPQYLRLRSQLQNHCELSHIHKLWLNYEV